MLAILKYEIVNEDFDHYYTRGRCRVTNKNEEVKTYHISMLNIRLDLKNGEKGILTKRKGELYNCHIVRIKGEGKMVTDHAIAKWYTPEESGYVQVAEDVWMENPLAPFKAWDEEFVSNWERALLSN